MTAVSVIMPVYNADRYVSATTQCILAQTFDDFEFIIINDGSTDSSLDILQGYARRDARIRLISRPNTGYITALNEGLGMARGELIARMDADDLCEPQRFELQVRRMREDTRLVALGSCATAIDAEGELLGDYSVPLTHEEIEDSHLRGQSSIHHPAVMMRPEAIRHVGGYRKEFMPCEDYDLWLRLGEIGRLENLPDRLLTKRLMAGSAVAQTLDKQEKLIEQILGEAWHRRGLPNEPEIPSRVLYHRADLYRQWAWMALKEGRVGTSRRYAVKAICSQPFRPASWRLIACLLRGR